MSFTSVGEFHESSADYSATTKGSDRKYTRTFLAVSNDQADGAIAAISYVSDTYTIVKGSYYSRGIEYDQKSFCQAMKARRQGEDGLNWLVTIEYAPYPNAGPDDTPWHQPAKVVWNNVQTEQVLSYDNKNKLICNSAGDPFLDPCIREVSRPTLQVTQNEQTYDEGTALGYSNCVNNNTFMGAPPRTLRVNIGAERVWDVKWGFYWTVNYNFTFNELTWDKILEDKGFREKDGRWILLNGAKPTTAVLLDGNGKKLENGADPQFKNFKIYKEINFRFTFRGV